MHKYPSDISREQFEIIREDLENARKHTRPRKVDLYDVFCAILYVLKSGCQWRMLPSDFPKMSTVYWYWGIWTEEREDGSSLLEEVLKKLVKKARLKAGRSEKTSFCILDAQSVKNTDSAREKGYDAGKKVSGIKRHIAVDTNGLPHALHVTTANISDKAGAVQLIGREKDNLSHTQAFLCDGGYIGKPFAEAVKALTNADVQIVKRNELHTFAVIPKRWVVERSFAWLEKCHRLWKNCERKLHTSLLMVVFAFIALLLNRY